MVNEKKARTRTSPTVFSLKTGVNVCKSSVSSSVESLLLGMFSKRSWPQALKPEAYNSTSGIARGGILCKVEGECPACRLLQRAHGRHRSGYKLELNGSPINNLGMTGTEYNTKHSLGIR